MASPIYVPSPLDDLNSFLMRLIEMRDRKQYQDAMLAQNEAQESRLSQLQAFNEAQTRGPQMVADQALNNMLQAAAAPMLANYNPISGQMMAPVENTAPQAAMEYAQLKRAGAKPDELRAAAFGPDREGMTGLYARARGEGAAKRLQTMRTEYLANIDKTPGLSVEQRANAKHQAGQVFSLLDQGIDKQETLDLLIPNEVARNYAVMQKTLSEVKEFENLENADTAATPFVRALNPAAFSGFNGVIPGAAKYAMGISEINHRAAMEKWTAEQKKALESGPQPLGQGIKHFQAELAKKIGDSISIVDPEKGFLGVRPRYTTEEAFNETIEEFRRSGYFGLTPGLEQYVHSQNNKVKESESASVPAVKLMIQSGRTAYPELGENGVKQKVEDNLVGAGWSIGAARRLYARALGEIAKEPKQRSGRQSKAGSRLFGN